MISSFAVDLSLKLFPLLMIAAGAWDVMDMRIPNLLIILLAGSFLPIAAASGMTLDLMAQHVATGLVLLLAGYVLFSFRVIGGGDAKLAAAAGLWLGAPNLALFLLFSGLAGGVVSVAVGLWFMTVVESGVRSDRLARLFAPLAPDVPYGLPLAVGAILTVPHSWWMHALAHPT